MRAWDIPSPCIGICRLDPDDGLCQGCWRSTAEIAAWPGMSAEQRLALLDALARRRDADGLPTGGGAGVLP
ncbi:MAG: DUF1289 domain-containing protein [Alphaproteobacteria bacterium]|nr:DUF1289 domain-containing protein [Alphaproteobacteria bacterium]